jgi:uncharacterized membrane protein
VSLNDWILSFHLLSAAALVGAMTLFSILIAGNWRADRPATVASFMRLAVVGNVLVGVGTAGTIVFGIWLALAVDGYNIWDGWVLAAIVLWAVATELGRRAGTAYTEAGNRAQELAKAGNEPSRELAQSFGPSPAFRLHVVSSIVILLILIDMIWKPGA